MVWSCSFLFLVLCQFLLLARWLFLLLVVFSCYSAARVSSLNPSIRIFCLSSWLTWSPLHARSRSCLSLSVLNGLLYSNCCCSSPRILFAACALPCLSSWDRLFLHCCQWFSLGTHSGVLSASSCMDSKPPFPIPALFGLDAYTLFQLFGPCWLPSSSSTPGPSSGMGMTCLL